ncbi:TonB-dependent receptor [Edaphobacter aggregans]|uniref:TonB-dependent receptor n=1 Tax=Edaphobacter aggregans TaxID=570835 RepID=UPI000554B241|nr:TonB-dependent receptor [Edaphobacter aggregans]
MKKALACYLVLLLSPLFLRAQVADNTALVGTVTDPTGSVVVGSKVVGVNQETKVSYSGTTNSEGYYSIPFVSPGTYDVTVEMSGFRKMTSTGVVVQLNHAVRTDFSLSVGSETSIVSVSADTPALSTDDALLGETIDSQQVHDLPLNGRHAIDLAATASNITISGQALTGNPPGNRASGSGTRNINNSISLDGISIMNNLITTATLSPNPDALSAVQTQNGNYTAQYGDYLGVHINLVSRTGTNKFHGTAYDYIQNDALNAKGWLQPTTGLASQKAKLRYNLFGGVLSGPIIIPHLYDGRDKTFFTGSYEGLRNNGATPTIGTVLSNKMRTGDFSELLSTDPAKNKQLYNPQTRFRLCSAPNYNCPAAQYVGNIIPVDPVSANILPYMATPTGPGTTNNWNGNLPNQINEDSTLERVDHNINGKISLFGRFAWQSVNNYTQAINLANTAYTTTKTRNGAAGYTHIITPKLVNDLRFGFNIVNTNILNEQAQQNQTSAGSSLGIPGFTADVDSGNPGLVDMSIGGTPAAPIYQGIAQSGTNWYQDDRQLTWYDQISYTMGKHALMAGISFRKMTIGRSAANTARGQFTFDGTLNGATSTSGDAAAAFIAGSPTGYTSPFFQVKGSIGQWRDGFFAQDTWQVTQNFTLQYGLRYELPQVAYSLNGVGRIMDPGLTTLYPAIGGTNALNAATYPDFKFTGPAHDNISPRVGFSYRATDKIVIRGGGGIYYNANQLNSYTLSSTNYPYSAVVTPSAGFGTTPPFTLDNPNVPAPAVWPGPASSPYANFTVNHDLPTARMYQWNVDIGTEVWRNAGLEFQYLGSRTIHLDESYYPNQPAPSPVAFSQSRRPKPAIGQIREIQNDGFATYNGLTVILRQRMSHGLSANLSYTWSHAMDTSDSSNDGGSAMWQGHLKLDYANSNYDIRNRFVASVTYELPKFDGRNVVVRQVLGGWQTNAIVDLRTGTPLNITINSNLANVGGVGGSQRPNYVHESHVTCSRATVTGSGGSTRNSCIDATAYANPAPGTFGNLQRDAIYAPGVANTNASLFKNFPIWETVSFQFRAEAFNLFNHPNPGSPNTTFGGSTFGYITGANTNFGARVMQLAGKINF